METIKTDRLILRTPVNSDKNLLFELLSDCRIAEFTPHLYCTTLEDAELFLYYYYYSCDPEYSYCILLEEQDSKEIVGIIEAYLSDDNFLHISYASKSTARGNGYMPEALKSFIEYIYDNTIINAVAFSIRCDNNSSIRIMEKLKIPLEKKVEGFFDYKLSLLKKPSW